MVQDVIPGFFSSSYTIGLDLDGKYPTGSLVQSGETIYYINGNTMRPFANSDVVISNGFKLTDIIKTTVLSGYTAGSSIAGLESPIASIIAQ
jgi:hypothetical protein